MTMSPGAGSGMPASSIEMIRYSVMNWCAATMLRSQRIASAKNSRRR